MARYRNKITGEIIHAHLFDGDLGKLKKEMPHIDYNHKKFPSCTNLIDFITDCYIMYSLYDTCFYMDMSKSYFEEKYEPYTESAISNAQQAIKWLEEGKKIRAKAWRKHEYAHLVDDIVRIDTGKQYNCFCELLAHTWELYEEPRYKEVSGKEAMVEFFMNNKKVGLVLEDAGAYKNVEFFLGYRDGYLNLILNKNNAVGITKDKVNQTDWRVYEEDNEC